MKHKGARSIMDSIEIDIAYLNKLMYNLFPVKNDCASLADLEETLKDLSYFKIRTRKDLRKLVKKHRSKIILIDKMPMDKWHQNYYRKELGEETYLDTVRRQYWFCYPALVRLALKLEFGDEYENYTDKYLTTQEDD